MKVTIAENAGFCFGVERAINIVYKAMDDHGDVVTFGPIIHNPQVVKSLEDAGVGVIESLGEITPEMTVVIRTHGIPFETLEQLKSVSNVIDATCPFVKKVQLAAKNLSDSSYFTVVVGEKEHPEVQSIVSYINGDYTVVNTLEEAKELAGKDRLGVVAQTTQNENSFNDIVESLSNGCSCIEVSNTICNATHNRQRAALELAKNVDVMIIVGGRNSANTTRLFQLCKDISKKTYHIETVNDLDDSMFLGEQHVGLSAGASTPAELVEQVKEYILERANE